MDWLTGLFHLTIILDLIEHSNQFNSQSCMYKVVFAMGALTQQKYVAGEIPSEARSKLLTRRRDYLNLQKLQQPVPRQ